MEKKYQVFISSTYIDLIEERQAVVEAVLKANHIPAGMELFKSGKSQLETIKKWIDNSDIYVLILGGRYGSIDKETGKSYTQLEYEYALDKDMPVFAIVINEEMTKKKIKESEDHENVIEVYNKKKYDEFKQMVRNKIISSAGSLPEIKLRVHENIHQFERNYKLKGWVRGDNLKENEELQEKKLKSTMNITELSQNIYFENIEKLKDRLEQLLRNLFDFGSSSVHSITNIQFVSQSTFTKEKIIEWFDNLKVLLEEHKWSKNIDLEEIFRPLNIEYSTLLKIDRIPSKVILDLYTIYSNVSNNDKDSFIKTIIKKFEECKEEECPF